MPTSSAGATPAPLPPPGPVFRTPALVQDNSAATLTYLEQYEPSVIAASPLAVTPAGASLASPGGVGGTPSSPAAIITPTSSALNTPTPPGVTTTGPLTTPVSASSPATTSPTCNALLQSVLNSLSSGGNAASSGTGSGVGADDTSLPSPTTADVEALQPTTATTSSSGPNIGLIIGIVLVLALGVYLWYRYKKGHTEAS